MQEDISLRIDADVATISLDRTHHMNALTLARIDTFMGYLDSVDSDRSVKALVIRSSVDGVFSVGDDIFEMDGLFGLSGFNHCRRGQKWLDRLERLSVPSIAVVDGWALGGGCELCLACTFRMASTRARFGLPEIKIGVMPGFGGTQRLPEIVGRSRAMEMILTGEPIDAAKALRMGLVLSVSEPSELDDTVTSFVSNLIQNPRDGLTLAKLAIEESISEGSKRSFILEAQASALLTTTANKQEGMEAFKEKRLPVWTT